MKEGYKRSELGEIPVEWEVVELKGVSQIIVSNVDKKSVDGEKSVLLCNYMDVYQNDYIHKELEFMSATASEAEIEKFLLKKGDVIITKDSETKDDIAKSAVVVEDFGNILCGYHLALLRPDHQLVDGNYLSKTIQLGEVKKQLTNKANGTTRFGLNVGTIEELQLPLPPLPEQQKIAAILSTVDEKIEVIEGRIAQTQALKKGLMQKLLTEGIGHSRFKDSALGRIPESWEVVKLGDLVDKIVGGGTPSRENENYWTNEIPWATVKDLKGSILHDTKEYISKSGLKGSASNFIAPGTLIIATRMALGKAVFFTKGVAINQDLKAIYPKLTLNSQFLFYWLMANAELIKSMGSGSTVKGIRLEVLRSLDFKLPSVVEQQEISKILCVIDEKLEILESKKQHFQDLKKGLMQQLLTGRVRVGQVGAGVGL